VLSPFLGEEGNAAKLRTGDREIGKNEIHKLSERMAK
jgi:hypothetical protein